MKTLTTIKTENTHTALTSYDKKMRSTKIVLRILEVTMVILLFTSVISAFAQQISNYPLFNIARENVAGIEKVTKFTVACNTGKVYVNWIVKEDVFDCIYIVERSADGDEYEAVGLKEGIGSRLELLYSFIDDKPLPGVSYYRLKKIGDNYATFYTEPIIINNENTTPKEGTPMSLN